MSFLKGVDIVPVNKSWISLSSRSCEEYINGVIEFVDYSFQHIKDEDNSCILMLTIWLFNSCILFLDYEWEKIIFYLYIDISNMVLGFNYVFVE